MEKYIGDFLILLDLKFEYEPYINLNGKVYFPDFKTGNMIIEVTAWAHPAKEKISHIFKKISNYERAGYQVILFTPKNIRKFYKALPCPVVSTLPKLEKFICAPVA